jgi:hypothetical protein
VSGVSKPGGFQNGVCCLERDLELTVDIIDDGSWSHIDLQNVRSAVMRMDDSELETGFGVQFVCTKLEVSRTGVVVERRKW